jgi:lipopolysaccharide exporter
MNLRRQAFAGLRWTAFSSLGRAILQFLQIAILARLLTPADFGLIAITVSIMAFVQIFSDAGVSNAIIHFQYISEEQLSSLYWLNVSVSIVLALLLIICGYWVASWYQQVALQYLLIMAAATLVVGALGQQIRIIAQKRLQFAGLAKVDLIASSMGFITTVTFALVGAGVYSLILGGLVTAVVGCSLVWMHLSVKWRPQARLQLAEIRQFLKFGAFMIGNNLANTINSQIDILIGGKLLDAHSMGLYSLPKDISQRIAGVINPIITIVGLPVMSKAQNDRRIIRQIYLQTMRMTNSVSFPVYIAMAIFAPEIVRLLLGNKWEASIQLLQIMVCWALIRGTGSAVGSLLMATGRADLSFKWNMVWLFAMPPIIWIGSSRGTVGMAMALLAIQVLGYIPNWYFLVRPLCGAKLNEYTAQLGVPFILSLVAGIVGHLTSSLFTSDLLRLTIGILFGAVVYLVLCWRFNRIWVDAMLELGFQGAKHVKE